MQANINEAFSSHNPLDKKTFQNIRDFIYDKCGINLAENKISLVQARLAKRMRTLKINDYQSYFDYMIHDSSGEEMIQMIDSISTNVTSFYREPRHFDFLENTVKSWMLEGQKKFRLWSAACSSGEEPYTMAITMLETAEKNGYSGFDIKILATDISTKVLKKSMLGEYSEEKIKTIPGNIINKYFNVVSSSGGQKVYQVNEKLKKTILFRQFNLNQNSYPIKGPLDIIFCRNVMIYFDNIVRKRLLDNFTALLKKQGYLMVGHSESLTGMISKLRSVQPAIYIKD